MGTATKGFAAAGGTVSIDVSNGNSFVNIGQVKSISFTNPKWQYEDVTCLSSPTFGPGVVKEQTPTLLDPGTMTGQAIYLPSDAGLVALRASNLAGNVAAFKVQLPIDIVGGQSSAGDKYTFSGYVSELPLPDTLDTSKIVTYKFTVQINTVISPTQGS
jgi:hypothetical protein